MEVLITFSISNPNFQPQIRNVFRKVSISIIECRNALFVTQAYAGFESQNWRVGGVLDSVGGGDGGGTARRSPRRYRLIFENYRNQAETTIF